MGLISLELPEVEAACTVKNVIIIGAGISGAAAAHEIVSSRPGCFKVHMCNAREIVVYGIIPITHRSGMLLLRSPHRNIPLR